MDRRKRKLCEIGEIVSGATPRTNDSSYYGGDIAWITPADLSGYSHKYISHGARNITQRGYDSCATQLMPKGTVLFSSRAPIGYVAIASNDICTNQGFKSIVPNENIDSEFLYYQLIYLRNTIRDMGSGTTFKEISGKKLGQVEVMVPPLHEQRRIVARIEELFSELDNSVSTLQKTKNLLGVYRQAVLKEAFDSIDARIVSIQSICTSIVDCPHSTPKWTDNGYLCLRTTNFRRGFLDLSERNYVTKETFDIRNARLIPLPGDVLYSREGAILGLACVIPDGIYACLGQRMMLLRPGKELNNKFLMHYLNSPRLTNYVASVTGGSASPHINVGDIKQFQIPCPSILRQKEIVDFIESRLSICDSIEHTVNTTLQKAEAMRQSILKQAFEGNL